LSKRARISNVHEQRQNACGQRIAQYSKTLDPARGVVDPEELRRLREASEWQGKVYAAEHAVFIAEHGTPGIVGSHGRYQWLTMVDRDITSLLSICPEVVLGKYLAVTRIDGGSLRLTDEEKSAGWWTAEAGKVFQGTSWSTPEYRDDWKIAVKSKNSCGVLVEVQQSA
jgi:hypothetical protein